MHVALIALIPLLHILLVVGLVVAAGAQLKRNPGLSGLLALIAAFVAAVTVLFFLTVLRGC